MVVPYPIKMKAPDIHQGPKNEGIIIGIPERQ
jgi:hypothetical protein